MSKRILSTTLAALLLAGCGSDNNGQFTANSTPVNTNPLPVPSVQQQVLVNQAKLQDINGITKLIPSRHLNQTASSQVTNRKGTAMTIPVAELELSYDTLFGSLSSTLNVTNTTSQVVNDTLYIAAQPGTGNFDLYKQPIAKNPLGVTAVSFQPLEYDTTVPLPGGNQTFHVSGGLLMPLGISKSQVKGVIVYFHGTTFNKSQVGSEYIGNTETQLNAEVFASQGYIVAIPDYVGQGVDWQDVHPYVLYPKVSAQTAVDMLTAVRPTITTQYGYTSTDAPLKLFSAGYSEGGSYSLWFNSYISSTPAVLNSFYKLTHSVGMEGAYSTSNVTYGYLFDNVDASSPNLYNVQSQLLVNVVKPILSADAFLSYATYQVASDFASIFNTDFFAMKASGLVPQSDCNVGGQQLTIQQAFAMPDTTIAQQLLSSGLEKRGNGAVYPLDLPFATTNSINSLVSSSLLTTGPLAQLKAVLTAADANLTSVADNGVSIISLMEDSVVVPNNFDLLLSLYPTKIKNAIKVDQTKLQVLSSVSDTLGYPVWEDPDHLHGPVYEFLYALNIFNSF